MARTRGAKGKRTVGSVRARGDSTLVPINSQRIREMLADRPLLPLAREVRCDPTQLRRLRDGKQASWRLGKLKRLAVALGVEVIEFLVTSGQDETQDVYRVDVTARSLARECWEAAGQAGDPPFWLTDLLRTFLNLDTWKGAFWDGGHPVLVVSPQRGTRLKAKALRLEERRRRHFCDQLAYCLRLVLPTQVDLEGGVRVNPRRAGALLRTFRDKGMSRLLKVSTPGSTVTRRVARIAAAKVASGIYLASKSNALVARKPKPKK